jgi:galactose-1-phosphate uridylyltransferase
MTIEFQCESLLSRFQNPGDDGYSERKLQVRFDPLLGTSARIAEGVKLQTRTDAARVPFRTQDPNCPFCVDRIDKVTPRISTEIAPAGRIRVGDTVLFPNLVPYSKYAAVAVFTTKHWLNLLDFTSGLIFDNLTAFLDYIRAVTKTDREARFCAYNINYLYPSGGSHPHPHSQMYLDPLPTSLMRMQHSAAKAYCDANKRCFWNDLVSEEMQRAERMIARHGSIVWMTPFAPIGFNEVRAVLGDHATILDLSTDDIQKLALGISRILKWYDSIGYDSFNLALYSGELGKNDADRVNLTLVTRTAMPPFYRSDSMHLERLHWEAAVDRTPEDVAADIRQYFHNTNGA